MNVQNAAPRPSPTSGPEEPFLDLVGIAVPIVQAPMAGSATPQLAAAVSDAGGLDGMTLDLGSRAALPLTAVRLNRLRSRCRFQRESRSRVAGVRSVTGRDPERSVLASIGRDSRVLGLGRYRRVLDLGRHVRDSAALGLGRIVARQGFVIVWSGYRAPRSELARCVGCGVEDLDGAKPARARPPGDRHHGWVRFRHAPGLDRGSPSLTIRSLSHGT